MKNFFIAMFGAGLILLLLLLITTGCTFWACFLFDIQMTARLAYNVFFWAIMVTWNLLVVTLLGCTIVEGRRNKKGV